MNDTIVAIATPTGEGGIGVIRISGDQAVEVVAAVFRPSSGRKEFWEPRRVHCGSLIDPASGKAVDEVLLIFFKSPHSYTSEDVVEIHAHGGVYVIGRILKIFIDRGARLAEPGEFTRRAFLNGRIDLSQAEAVADIISAESEKALEVYAHVHLYA